MSSAAHLVFSKDATPKARTAKQSVLSAPGVVPLGWMAMFRPGDVREVTFGKRVEVTAMTSVAAALANLQARMPVLLSLASSDRVGAYLASLVKYLEGLDLEHYLRIGTDELATPWATYGADHIRLALHAFDTQDPLLWNLMLDKLGSYQSDDVLSLEDDSDEHLRNVFVGAPANPKIAWASGAGPLPEGTGPFEATPVTEAPVRPYVAAESYRRAERVEHEVHGKGYVRSTHEPADAPNLMEVLFSHPDGKSSTITLPFRETEAHKVTPYVASTRFNVGDVVLHPTFGLGAVTKVDVSVATFRFATAVKVLAHDKSGADALARPQRIDHSMPTPGARKI